MRIRRALLFLAFVLLSSQLLIRGSLAQDKIVAIVNKDVITQKDLNDFINFMRVQLSVQYQGRELENKIQSMKLDLLDKLIEDRLILQEAKKENIRIDPQRVESRIEEIKKHYGSDVEFQRNVAKQGLVRADIEKKIREQMLMYAVVDSKIRNRIIIKPSEVTDFYRQHTNEFILNEQREFESMSTDSLSLAEEITDRLKKGESMEGIAKTYSLPVNKFTCSTNGELRQDIEEAVFKIKLGEVCQPLKIGDNYYVLKLNNIIFPRQQNLAEVQDKIYMLLFEERMQSDLEKWLDELRKNSYVKLAQD
ncbi:MAG: SurA N-terminal domain-containing protein [Candidatus Omnitrophica bacterium]|nr:SurA N-terminal domain-containing protein [Candidatus Omnitrophota bacterium]MDD5553179.1 SurA N-terminal domain-containing protein [Candidatus Omnitrophota bacterium]